MTAATTMFDYDREDNLFDWPCNQDFDYDTNSAQPVLYVCDADGHELECADEECTFLVCPVCGTHFEFVLNDVTQLYEALPTTRPPAWCLAF